MEGSIASGGGGSDDDDDGSSSSWSSCCSIGINTYGGDDANPWEVEEATNRFWDRMLEEMSLLSHVDLDSATTDVRSLPYLDETFIKWFSGLQFELQNDRWERLAKFMKDAYAEEDILIVEDTFEEQLKLEVILFSEGDRQQQLRRKLARGLVSQVWRNAAPKSAPWHSRIKQLIRDIDACCFLKRLLDARSFINCYPMIVPYNVLEDVIYGFVGELFDGETSWSPYIEGDFMYSLFSEGFITIATTVSIGRDTKTLLIPKLHTERSYLVPLDVIMTRKGRKAAKELRITMDTAFHKVVAGIVSQHGENWMYPEMQRVFNRMHYQRHRFDVGATRMHSVEVWKGSDLVAGEIGVATGAVYTSITGFHTIPSSGTFQMYALGAILHFQDIEIWDLGMDIPYKRCLGATTALRTDFLVMFQEAKTKPRIVEVPERFRHCKDGVDLLNAFSDEQKRHRAEMAGAISQ